MNRARLFVRLALARVLKRQFKHRVRPWHIRCHRATAMRISCGVRWRVKKASGGFRHYRGKVVVRRVSATKRRYALRIRGWMPGCKCTRVIKRTGRL
jgi:hypothetical protein